MITVLQGDWIEQLKTLESESVQCCVTSPPYWGLRDYGVEGQLGLEKTPEEYVSKIVEGFREVRRVLRDDGTLWLNLGDSYASDTKGSGGPSEKQLSNAGSRYEMNQRLNHGLKSKDLVGIPWRVAFALQADGWYLRSDIIWHKPNPMPESVTDRPTKSHEYIFLLSKNARYFYDAEAIKEDALMTGGGLNHNGSKHNQNGEGADNSNFGKYMPTTRNKRTVWTVATSPYSEAHFATFPPDLIKPCILAGTSARGCCSKCGSPWERVIETNNPSKDTNTGYDMTNGTARTGNPQTSNGLHRNGGGVYSSSKTLGWKQICDCVDGKTIPCTILDPFGGSGTTGMVAIELGRKAILIELNPAYVELIHKRCNVTPGLSLA